VEPGDLCVFEVASHDGDRFLLASFHGDSAGRCTAPVLAGLHALADELCPGHTLLFGLDANTAGGGGGGGGGDADAGLGVDLAGRGLASCWRGQEAGGLWTTFSARTALQPQLHKAVRPGDVGDRRHRRLKDWILFYDAQLDVVAAERDNGGDRSFCPDRATPSLAFPSDHAIVAATFRVPHRPRSVSLPSIPDPDGRAAPDDDWARPAGSPPRSGPPLPGRDSPGQPGPSEAAPRLKKVGSGQDWIVADRLFDASDLGR
jgi:hypothetical protein